MTKIRHLIVISVIGSAVVATATVFLACFILGINFAAPTQQALVAPEGIVLASSFPGPNATAKLDQAIQSCGSKRSFVIATPDIGLGAPSNMPDNVTLIDLRQESVRILRRGFPLSAGAPQYFADEPSNSTLVVADSVPRNVSHAQDQAIAGLIDNYSPNVNAVGIWGGARALAKGSRAWGGSLTFLTATLGMAPQNLGQMPS